VPTSSRIEGFTVVALLCSVSLLRVGECGLFSARKCGWGNIEVRVYIIQGNYSCCFHFNLALSIMSIR
jgi:hypothetical protein